MVNSPPYPPTQKGLPQRNREQRREEARSTSEELGERKSRDQPPLTFLLPLPENVAEQAFTKRASYACSLGKGGIRGKEEGGNFSLGRDFPKSVRILAEALF